MALALLDNYDALLVDLDGTVFEGHRPIDGAREGLVGRNVMYITNNASRAPEEVATHLTHIGFPTKPGHVLTSAQAACVLAAEELGTVNARAYVIGADSFKELVARAGFQIVESADDYPEVVFHGHSPHNNWGQLSEGALAIRAGARYIASNLDTTLPSERGLLIGNGSLVAAVVKATGVQPTSAGKPEPAMFRVGAETLNAQRPLVIGDRLNTDIAGGIAAGFDTLCTITGVSGHRELLTTPHRPTYIAGNMRDHLPGWVATVRAEDTYVEEPESHGAPAGTKVTIIIASGATSTDINLMAAEAVAAAAPPVWHQLDKGIPLEAIHITTADDAARRAVEVWR